MKRLYTLIVLVGFLGASVAHAEKPKKSSEDTSAWGVGMKARVWRLSKRFQRLFVDESPGPAQDKGLGIDLVRRRGNLEVSFGFGYDRFSLENGYYLEKGGNPLSPGTVDYTTFDNFGWVTAEMTVVRHLAVHPNLELRLGGGVGLGWLTGRIRKTEAVCTSERVPEDCSLNPTAPQNESTDIPPVLPVINLLVGVEVKPFEFLHFHIDGGLHSTPYIGVGMTLYLR